ncbi:MAG: hypothetical protein WBP64_10270 [Nitrososphaeraceae archaeon]
MVLTREEKEKIVLELHGQGKGTREIAKEVRISFSQISAILKKAAQQRELGQERKEKTSVSTQAYTLFSKGKTTLEVTLALRLKADEAIEYRKEYCRLIQHDDLIHVYESSKDC